MGSRSVVAMSLWGPCQIGEQVSGGHVTVRSCHSVQQATGCHVTLGGMSQWAASVVVAMSLWGLCRSGQRVSGGHVTVGAM